MPTPKSPKRILVAIKSPSKPPRRALAKAATIARQAGATIELFHAIADPIVSETLRRDGKRISRRQAIDLIRADRQESIDKLIKSPLLRGVKCSAFAEWDFPVQEAIVRRALAKRADLVVLESEHHIPGAHLVVSHSDWELIRTCPMPVLLVRTARKYQKPKVLAAIDPQHAHDKPASLDKTLLATAASYANLLAGELHAAHAYRPYPFFAPGYPGQYVSLTQVAPEIEQEHRAKLAKAVDKLASTVKIPTKRQHLLLGDAADEIPTLAKKLGAAIVVMGAVSRSGLRRLFIGHTAQKALERMPCDVLVVKPKSFKSPISKTSRPFGPITGFTV
ncbi:MAG: universal stress protein, partial [Steroidobacteraceae bacterium]